MSERDYGQQGQMEDETMVGTLRAQAEMIWPLEKPILDRLGFDQMRQVADLGCGTGQFASRVASAWPLVSTAQDACGCRKGSTVPVSKAGV